MSRHHPPLPHAFDPQWSADQFSAAADTRLRLGSAALARFALPASANSGTACASVQARRRLFGGYAPQAALTPFRVRG